MTLEEAILLLQDRDDFETIVKAMRDYKETHVADLANIKNAENPQLLAYLAGGISAMSILLEQIDGYRTGSNKT